VKIIGLFPDKVSLVYHLENNVGGIGPVAEVTHLINDKHVGLQVAR
jgi:hypothetical protein